MTNSPARTNTALLIIAIIVVLAALKAASALVVPLLLATFIATIASTPMRWLNRQKLFGRYRIPMWISVVFVLSTLILILIGLSLVIVQVIREFQAEQVFYEERIRTIAADIIRSAQSFGLTVSEDDLLSLFDPGRVFRLAGQTLQSVVQLLSNTFFILLTVIFILAEGASLPRKLYHIFRQKNVSSDWLRQFGTKMNRYIAVKSTTSLLTGISVTVVLVLMGVDFAILWGLLAFLLNYIPNIGSVIAAAPAVLVTVVQLGFGPAFFVLFSYIAINVAIGAGIEPRFLGRTLGLSTLVVFLSLIFWGWMFGTVGMFLSVPLTMTAKIGFESRPSTEWIASLLGPAPRSNAVNSPVEPET
ncbi:MAG: AI-2E family transporter [Gammaproteobacteria bacterium]|nr:AI-2E family transporter [Gammaproteobacteria bacterium]